MPTTRGFFGSAVVDGQIYAIGGLRRDGETWFTVPTVEVYNPAANNWDNRADMPTPRADIAAEAVGGKIYTIGGFENVENVLGTVEEYNPDTNTWSSRADMPTPRADLSAAAVGGKIYAIGGSESAQQGSSIVEEFDTNANKWTPKANMLTGRFGVEAVAVGGRIYAIGGKAGPDFFATVEEFNPAANN